MRFEDLFCEPLLSIQYKIRNPVINTMYPGGEIGYVYNNYGYRTHHIPDKVIEPHWLIVGCSHTEGVGVELDYIYPNLIEKKIGIKVFNLAQGGGNNFTNELNVIKWIENIGRPEQIIVQWPSPYRKFIWEDDTEFSEFATRITPKDNHPLYNLTAKYSTKNFLYDQIKSIIITNKFCQTLGIKIFNFMVDSQESVTDIIKVNNITLYDNSKGEWLTDSSSADLSHHSKHCHAQWAHRIMDLIK